MLKRGGKAFRASAAARIQQNSHEVYKRNCKNFETMALGGAGTTGIIVIVGILMNAVTRFQIQYLLFSAYFLFLYLFASYYARNRIKKIRLAFYLAVAPVMLLAVLMGSFFDPNQPAITILILLNVIPFFIIDIPSRVICFQSAWAVMFIICSYFAKDNHWFLVDLVDICTYTVIAIGMNYISLMGRIESAENYTRICEKSEKDGLTGLLNRTAGDMRVQELLENSEKGTFMIIDVDNFKRINDIYGHLIGDEVLIQISWILKISFEPDDIVWRLGGDEFAVFARKIQEKSVCQEKISLLEDRLRELGENLSIMNSISVSIGCRITTDEREEYETLYKYSDLALYEVKKQGKGCGKIWEQA